MNCHNTKNCLTVDVECIRLRIHNHIVNREIVTIQINWYSENEVDNKTLEVRDSNILTLTVYLPDDYNEIITMIINQYTSLTPDTAQETIYQICKLMRGRISQ